MAIKPQFSQAILSGNKHVEFRKRRLADDVATVLIYESAPTRRIVGQFTIARTVEATPKVLWREYEAVGGIPYAEFFNYYAGYDRAVGFVVDDAQRYRLPVALDELSTSPAVPQSFVYLPSSTIEEVHGLQPAAPVISLARFAGHLLQAPGRFWPALPPHRRVPMAR